MDLTLVPSVEPRLARSLVWNDTLTPLGVPLATAEYTITAHSLRSPVSRATLPEWLGEYRPDGPAAPVRRS